MGNTITNILTINGSEKQVSKVRKYLRLFNNETNTYETCETEHLHFVPVTGAYKDKLVDYPGCPFKIPDWRAWEWDRYGLLGDTEPISDELVDAPNRIMFATKSDPLYEEIVTLSAKFPRMSFNLIFSDSPSFLYSGEYTFKAGKVISKRWYNCLLENISNITEDEAMEYYFKTNEWDRENWKKREDGEWVNLEWEKENEEEEEDYE